MNEDYLNFVRPTSSLECVNDLNVTGEDVRKFYLEEIGNVQQIECVAQVQCDSNKVSSKVKRNSETLDISNLQLFKSVQNDNIDKLRNILDSRPECINTTDSYGWSLLMIACQANSVAAVKELLRRGIDTTVRDKAGNSAQSLVIKNKNVLLAHILWDHRNYTKQNETVIQHPKSQHNDSYICETCDGKSFYNKQEHLSSTVHNINASKGKKVPTTYVIPESNKGYQIMLKVGWDKESGLGPDGSGKKYPIKAIQKKDKTGLGHDKMKKVKSSIVKESTKLLNKKQIESDYQKNRRIEINFRREFY